MHYQSLPILQQQHLNNATELKLKKMTLKLLYEDNRNPQEDMNKSHNKVEEQTKKI